MNTFACLGDAAHGLHKLPHLLRLLRVAEVEAIRNRPRHGANRGHIAHGFDHCVYPTPVRVNFTVAGVMINRKSKPNLFNLVRVLACTQFCILHSPTLQSGQAAFCIFERLHHTGIRLTRFNDSDALDAFVILFVNRSPAGDVGVREDLEQRDTRVVIPVKTGIHNFVVVWIPPMYVGGMTQ